MEKQRGFEVNAGEIITLHSTHGFPHIHIDWVLSYYSISGCLKCGFTTHRKTF